MRKNSKITSQSLFDLLGEKFDHKLERTTPLKELPEDMRTYLEPLYSATEFKARRQLCASIINSMYTERLDEFLMSENLLEKLIKRDKNLKRSTMDHRTYTELYAYLVSKDIIEVLEQPGQMAKGQKAKAGKWKWIERSTLQLLAQYWTEDGLHPDHEFEENIRASSTRKRNNPSKKASTDEISALVDELDKKGRARK